jgi:hypothetical protein
MNRFQYKAYSDHPWLVETGKTLFKEYLSFHFFCNTKSLPFGTIVFSATCH